MKRFLIIIVVFALIMSGCNRSEDRSNVEEPTAQATKSAVTPTPAPENDEPQVEEIVVEQVNPMTLPENSLNGVIASWDVPDETTQLILVTANDDREKMYLMEKAPNGLWQVKYGPFEAEIGRNGLGKEKEGDGKSPVGLFELGYAFGRYGAPSGTTWPWRDTVAGDRWIEDYNSKYYNLFVKEEEIEDKDWKNASNLNISAYDRAIEVRYNEDRVPKAGSAIFIHCWKDSTTSTSGCTAIAEKNMNTLVSWMDPAKHTLFLQVSYEMLGEGDLEYLCDFDYSIKSDIKFAGSDNFFGEQLPGYNTNTVITKMEIVEKILDINAFLNSYDRTLYIYEAYRPLEAYDYINKWIASREDTLQKELYYPAITTSDLVKEFYKTKDMALYPRAQVLHVGLADLEGNPLSMGGEYHIFDETARYDYTKLTADEEFNREILHDFMVNAGFESRDGNWWEYYYDPNPYTSKYDEIIQ